MPRLTETEDEMGLLQRLFGAESADSARAGKGAAHSQLGTPSQFPASQFAPSQDPRNLTQSPHSIRKELLRLVLRETLTRNGIPVAWIGADALVATSTNRSSGIHVRLAVKHWDSRIMLHSVALQENFEKRLLTLDPLAGNWLMGISWQFALPPEAEFPPLPHPGSWTAPPPEASAPTLTGYTLPMMGGSADVIAGPVRIARPNTGKTQGLLDDDTEFARRNPLDFAATRDMDENEIMGLRKPPGGFDATEPASLNSR